MAPKRPHDRQNPDSNGKRKWQKTSSSNAQQGQLKISPGTVVFRVLCPASKTGSLIGKGGGIVTKIRQETGAKIRIEETVPGCDERIVIITGSDKDSKVGGAQNVDNATPQDSAKNADEGEGPAEGDGDEKNEEKDVPSSEASQGEKSTPPAQRALLLIFERMAESDPESDDADETNKESASITMRLLVESSQVGCLLGKGGSMIKQMSADSGAHIRILPKDKLPVCASGNEELVQITGNVNEARKALQSVSQLLVVNPPRDHESLLSNRPVHSPKRFPSFSWPEGPRGDFLPPANFHQSIPPYPSRFREPDFIAPSFTGLPEGPPPARIQIPPEPLMFRLICVNDKVGSLIGKGGSIIKMIQQESGCDIKIAEISPESEDRVIVITGPALPDDRISPPQDAAFRVLARIATPAPEIKENVVGIKVIVSSSQTGCLLGKGGSIITEMRRSTGAHIRILSKEQIPKYISESDEVVQITGEPELVQEALFQITSRLRYHLFRDRFPELDYPAHPSFVDHGPSFGPYMGRRELSPSRPFSHLDPPFRKFDSEDGFHPHNERPFPPFGPPGGERFPPGPWRVPGIRDGAGLMPLHEYGGAPPRRMGGFPGGNQQTFITNTTVDVVVPRYVVPSIYGEDGGSLRQIRQISGANITINEAKPGATETVIIISGAPDQTHAAQSLIQAFVLSESEAP